MRRNVLASFVVVLLSASKDAVALRCTPMDYDSRLQYAFEEASQVISGQLIAADVPPMPTRPPGFTQEEWNELSIEEKNSAPFTEFFAHYRGRVWRDKPVQLTIAVVKVWKGPLLPHSRQIPWLNHPNLTLPSWETLVGGTYIFFAAPVSFHERLDREGLLAVAPGCAPAMIVPDAQTLTRLDTLAE